MWKPPIRMIVLVNSAGLRHWISFALEYNMKLRYNYTMPYYSGSGLHTQQISRSTSMTNILITENAWYLPSCK